MVPESIFIFLNLFGGGTTFAFISNKDLQKRIGGYTFTLSHPVPS